MSSILIKNVRVVDKNQDGVKDVLILNDRIEKVDTLIEFDADRVIDATGLILMPGFVDTHVHFREPGFEYKEDIETGSWSAINGGYTYVNLMANTKPICDNIETLEYVRKRARELDIVGINQCISITKGLMGQEFVDFDSLDDNTFVLSDDGKDLLSNHMMYQACKLAAEKNKLIMVHAEDSEISPYDYRAAEDLITLRDTYLSGVTGCHIHMSHVSTEGSIEAIKNAKVKGYNVTCEVTPHHISLYDNSYRVNPPIRTEADVNAIIDAIKEGVVDCVATDHAPHSQEDKQKGAPGLVGLETAFSVCNTYLVKKGHINYSKLSEIMSFNACNILRLKERGLIKAGYYADLALVDVDKEYVVDSSKFKSKSNNTPFDAKKLVGEIIMTIRNGKVMKDDNR